MFITGSSRFDALLEHLIVSAIAILRSFLIPWHVLGANFVLCAI